MISTCQDKQVIVSSAALQKYIQKRVGESGERASCPACSESDDS